MPTARKRGWLSATGSWPVAAFFETTRADRITAEGSFLASGEHGVGGLAPALGEPFEDQLDGLASHGRGAFLSAFAADPDMGAGAEVNVADMWAGEPRDAGASLDRDHQQRMVAAAEPGACSGVATSG
jgi:hypothetical protein